MLALVTGASSGFGYHICKKLINQGYNVIGIARRTEKLETIKHELGTNFLPITLDISESYEKTLDKLLSLPTKFSLKEIDMVVNNAGLALGLEPAYKADIHDWYQMLDTNIKGLISITRIVLPYMEEKRDGIIINMGSIAGSYAYPGANVYGATKAFVEQFSLNLRADLAGKGIRVSNIEPGLCGNTEFSLVRFRGDLTQVKKLYDRTNPILPEDIANVVLWIASQPKHININRIELMPTSQSFNHLQVTHN